MISVCDFPCVGIAHRLKKDGKLYVQAGEDHRASRIIEDQQSAFEATEVSGPIQIF